ncbi:MAG: vWA domain-containing protein [Gaiellaceae bacterium]
MTASAIPATEAARLRPAAVRTGAVRAVLGLALIGALALAFLVARGYDVRYAPLVPSGTTGMVVLDMSASVYEGAMEETIQKLARTGERAGLVVFSDAGYELLPPGTPGRELVPILRFLKPSGNAGELPVNPWQDFRAGTQISAGLRTAREALVREGGRGSILLISDLEILPDEVERLAAEVVELKREGITVRIVPLSPRPEKMARIEAITGPASLLREGRQGSKVRAPEERSLRAAAPWTFAVVALLLVLLLATNERVLSRLETRR